MAYATPYKSLTITSHNYEKGDISWREAENSCQRCTVENLSSKVDFVTKPIFRNDDFSINLRNRYDNCKQTLLTIPQKTAASRTAASSCPRRSGSATVARSSRSTPGSRTLRSRRCSRSSGQPPTRNSAPGRTARTFLWT